MTGLWHKAWCETRARFALAAAGITAAALLGDPSGESTSTLFILLVVLLGGGTLRQELALGTLGFTLALPVSRGRLFTVRAAAGALQVVALALLPAAVAAARGAAMPASPGWIACGLILLATALLVATLVTSELVTWLLTGSLFFAYELLVNATPLRRVPALDLYALLLAGGEPHGPRIAAVMAAAVAILVLAARSGDRAAREPGAGRAGRALRSLASRRMFSPLLTKAWRESRLRFGVALALLGGLALFLVVFQARLRALAGGLPYPDYLRLRFHESVGRSAFAMLAVVLALGGLQRERTVGTAIFSLALPVPRHAHGAARAAVGLAQVVALAWLPALLLSAASAAVGQHYAVAARIALQWTAGGAAIFAVALVISTLVRGELAGLAIGLIVLRLGGLGVLLRAPFAAAALTATAVAASLWLSRRVRFA